MTPGEEVVRAIAAVGGRIWILDDTLHYRLPQPASGKLLPKLRQHRNDIVRLLTRPEPPESRPPTCLIHRTDACWWHRPDGDAVCGLCHPDTFYEVLNWEPP